MNRQIKTSNKIEEQNTGYSLAIEIKGLCKSFGKLAALNDIDLDVFRGQVLMLLGPNGSGKTTLIKILGTLMKPDRGVVKVAGFDLVRTGQHVRRMIGVVTHETMLYEQLTGRENLRFVARMFGLNNIEQLVYESADKMGVTARLDQRVVSMSHGLKKRFSIARALLHDPLILLLDEPESGLDQEATKLLQDLIEEHSRNYRAVIMTTHDMEKAVSVGDNIAILSSGRITYRGSLDDWVNSSNIGNIYSNYSVQEK